MQKLLDPYIDDELDLVNTLEIEQHLQDCGACQVKYQNYLALRKAFKEKSLYYEPSPMLQKRIHTGLVKSLPRRTSLFSRLVGGRWFGLSAAVAALLILLGVGTGVILLNVASNATEQITQEVLDSHIRSLMLNHLEDVVSTDQHTVKPWFNGKLDFSPVVEDFAGQGYPLIGGRLDYLDKQPVAVLVYQRGKHIINVFSWRTGSTANSKGDLQTTTQQGYHIMHWTTGRFNYWVVSDLGETELDSFVQLVKTAIGGG
jgi:anti-sigma factor RsiW